LAANKRKILESARKLVQKGAKDKALKEYQKLIRLDPKDAKLRLEVGDAYRRWGQVDDAVDTYSKVAQQYMNEGFDARAVAVFKQILNLDPDRFDHYEPLAELYERMGLTAEAIQALQTAADGYHRLGKKREALELLRRMANADPSNTTSRIKVADLLRQEEMNEEAVAEYRHAAAELERQGDIESVGNVYRRILELDGSNAEALGALARNLVRRGKAAEAVPLAERALELDDGSAEAYETLADVYARCGRDADRGAVYRRLADLHRQRGDEDKAREIVQRHVPAEELSVSADDARDADELSGAAFLDEGEDLGGGDDDLFGEGFPETDESAPLDAGLETGLDAGTSQPILGDAGSAEAAPSLAPSQPLLDEEPLLEEPEPEPPPQQPQEPQPAAAAQPPTELDVEQLIAEASVYLRYGKREKAVAHLEAVLAAEPEHRGALEKLGEAFADGGEPSRAVEVWLRAAKRAREDVDEDAVGVLRGRIAALDAAAAATLDPAPPPEAPAPEPPEPERSAAPEPAPEIELDLSEVEEDLVLGDGDDDEAHEEFLDDDDASVSVGAEADADAGEAPVAVGSVADESLDSASLSTATTQQILEDLEEADFYMQQGLLDEAQRIYQQVLTVAPNHPRALVRLGEVAAARGAAPEVAPAAGAPAAAAAEPAAPETGAEDEAGIELAFDDDALGEDAEPESAAASDAAEPEIDVHVDVSEDEIGAPGSSLASEGLEDLSDLDLHDEDDDAEAAGADEGEDEEGSDTAEFTPSLDGSPEDAVGAEARSAAGHAAAEPEAEAGDFDLAAARSDAFDDDPGSTASGLRGGESDGFEAVFQAFKKGVSETLGESDHQAHYDLAIAYKEMGLLDDAMAELRLAMEDPSRKVECMHLLGVCALDAGQEPEAVEHLEALLALDGLSAEQTLAGRFDLGCAYQSLGDRERARGAFEAVVSIRSDFQDVQERLASLDAPPSDDKPDEDDTGGDFESFDDVMADVDDEEDAEEASAGESFDDLVAEANEPGEDDDADGGAVAEAPRPEPEAPEPDAEPAPAEPAPQPAGPAEPEPPSRPRKKKKISFV